MSATWTNHPSVIIEGNTPRLKIFRYLKQDPTLPKHLVDGMVVLNNQKSMTIEEYIRGADGMSSYRRSDCVKRIEKWHERMIKWFKSKMTKRSIPPETFVKAKELLEKNVISTDIDKSAIKLKALIEKTLANNQVALAKRLENEHKNIINESVLVKNGLRHYLTEEDVVSLLQKANFGIRIDFWNDYPDLVPDDVLEAKKKADALRVFDNWCVMHYDPKGEALKQIKHEEWRRDPILFGMIIGSDRLYFVKDWKTDKDDLTIQKVCGVLNIKELRDDSNYGAQSEFYNVIEEISSFASDAMEESGSNSSDIAMDDPVPTESDR